MLSFIADLGDAELRAARSAQGRITAADLYRVLVRTWLTYETRRADQRGAPSSLALEQRLDAASTLALALWRSTDRTIGAEQLEQAAASVLATMGDQPDQRDQPDQHGLDAATTAQILGSGTLLTRDAKGRFFFIHASVMEYLVAACVRARVDEDERRGHWPAGRGAGRRFGVWWRRVRPPVLTMSLLGEAEISDLTADFLIDLLGPDVAAALPKELTASRSTPALATSNALVLARRAETRLARPARLDHAQLAGQDLSGRVLSHQNLRGADLRGANLTDARLAHVDLSDADLTEANLTGARIEHSRFTGAALVSVTAHRSRWTATDLTDADLSHADFTAARLTTIDLRNPADLSGSRWTGALALGGHLVDAPALAATALAKRETAQPMIAPTAGPVTTLAYSPDGELLAFGIGTTVLLADARDGTLLRALTGHTDAVRAVAFSPDGHTLATSS
ncbi:pentapeptide repeat-containing protein, partial [Frankia canadensis]|uniref:pentapeptide repeat-containing protein n=1 Tax=Frankia canadensis TaxID=1836972 RepID=UPI001A9CAF8D